MNISKLSQPEYLHILINHLPIIGLMVAAALLAVFLLLRNRAAVVAGMVAVALLALSAWPVLLTGQKAYEKIDQLADEAGKVYLDRHMELAERWIYLYVATALIAGFGVVAARKRAQLLFPFAVATLVLAVGCLIAGAVIAENGGMVRHPEFRSGPTPASEPHQKH
jgi:hypothetical protein